MSERFRAPFNATEIVKVYAYLGSAPRQFSGGEARRVSGPRSIQTTPRRTVRAMHNNISSNAAPALVALRRARQAAGMTQLQLALRVGVSLNTISLAERSGRASSSLLGKLLKVLPAAVAHQRTVRPSKAGGKAAGKAGG